MVVRLQLWLTEGDIDHIIALDTELMRCDAWGSILALATNRCRGLLSLCISVTRRSSVATARTELNRDPD